MKIEYIELQSKVSSGLPIHMRRSIEAFKIEDIQRRCGVELL